MLFNDTNYKILREFYELTYNDYKNPLVPDKFYQTIIKDYIDLGIRRRDTPLVVSWDITNKCNLKCDFCSADAKCGYGSNELSTEQVFNIIEKLKKANVLGVTLQGGEPFLRSDIVKIIKELVSKGIYTIIVTNGTLVTEKKVEDFANIPRDWIRFVVSLDGSNEQVNSKIRGKGSFAKTLNAIKLLKQRNFDVRIQSVITDENYYDIVNMYKLAINEKVDSYGFTSVLPVGRGINFQQPDIYEVAKQAILIKKMQINLDDAVPLHGIQIGYAQNTPYIKQLTETFGLNDIQDPNLGFLLKCIGGKFKMEIDEDGQVYPCAFLRFPEFSGGNLAYDDLETIWNTDKWDCLMTIFRYTKDRCKDCDLYWCSTGCMAVGYAINKQLNCYDVHCKYCGVNE
ncbi:MAG: radical SAM protein [Halanaerobiales bacterium]|nr:radical SAM protein [Halanaerobiales bacterium]